MNIFITGSSGFIGKHFLQKLPHIHGNIYALTGKFNKNKNYHNKNIKWINKRLEEVCLDDLKNIDIVLHFAAVGVSPQKASLKQLEFINVSESLRLLKLANEACVKRFITTGTCLEYGAESDNWEYIPPTAELKPLCPYSSSKAKSFKLLNKFALQNKIEMFYGRIFSAYGEGQYKNNLWPSLKKAANSGLDFHMTNAEQIRDFIKVEEVANHLKNSLFRDDIHIGKPLVLNIGSGTAMKLKDFAKKEWLSSHAEGELIFGSLNERKYEIKRMVANINGLNHPCNFN